MSTFKFSKHVWLTMNDDDYDDDGDDAKTKTANARAAGHSQW